ncbi:MAG: aspartyl/asparaginyl beta-hydroxylase (cupin superfamily) [Halieaceae bacterium]|jgi:aspartyl/asparaginyl beta-hydroxylase (cupin superfamily)
MKNFELIRSNVALSPLLSALSNVGAAWDSQTGRQEKVRVQREALAVPIRGLRKSLQYGRARRDVQESRWTTGSARFPLIRHFLQSVAEDLDARLGRAKLIALPAGRRVYPHIDRGRYYQLHDRYHLVLKSSLGSWLRAGDEEVRMREGELWRFDNRQIHEARNEGEEDRIHLIFDMLPTTRHSEAGQQLRQARIMEEQKSKLVHGELAV